MVNIAKKIRYLNWRYSPISALCKACVMETPPPKWPYKVQYLHFGYLKRWWFGIRIGAPLPNNPFHKGSQISKPQESTCGPWDLWKSLGLAPPVVGIQGFISHKNYSNHWLHTYTNHLNRMGWSWHLMSWQLVELQPQWSFEWKWCGDAQMQQIRWSWLQNTSFLKCLMTYLGLELA